MRLSRQTVEEALRAHYREVRRDEGRDAPGAAEAGSPELEALALLMSGELVGPEAEAAREELAGSTRCRELIEILGPEAARAAGLAQVLRAETRWWRAPRRRPLLMALATAALIAMMVMPALLRDDGRPGGLGDASLVPKSGAPRQATSGGDALQVAAAREERRWRVHPGDHLRPGDSVGLFSAATRPGYLLVLHVDEAGDTTLLYPAGGTSSAALELGTEVPLPDGARMTQGEGCEWFVAVFSDEPLAIGPVAEALGEAAAASEACRLQFAPAGARTVRTLGVTR